MVDCRRTDNDSDPATNKLCKKIERSENVIPYFPDCEVACNIWHDSKCVSNMTRSTCTNLCISSSEYGSENDGWGWNYVNCIEQVLWYIQNDRDHSKDNHCAMMTALCRDVFATNISFSNFRASTWPSQNTSANDIHATPLSFYVAFTSCLLSAIIISLGIRGLRSRKQDESSNESLSKGEANFRGIQFTVISNNNHRFD